MAKGYPQKICRKGYSPPPDDKLMKRWCSHTKKYKLRMRCFIPDTLAKVFESCTMLSVGGVWGYIDGCSHSRDHQVKIMQIKCSHRAMDFSIVAWRIPWTEEPGGQSWTRMRCLSRHASVYDPAIIVPDIVPRETTKQFPRDMQPTLWWRGCGSNLDSSHRSGGTKLNECTS